MVCSDQTREVSDRVQGQLLMIPQEQAFGLDTVGGYHLYLQSKPADCQMRESLSISADRHLLGVGHFTINLQ